MKIKDGILKRFNERLDEKLTPEQLSQERKRNYKIKKRLSMEVADAFERLSKKTSDRGLAERYRKKSDNIRYCDNRTLFGVCPIHNKEKHMLYARFCKERLCPVCNYRRSQNDKESLTKLFEFMNSQEDTKYLKYCMLTLTVPNVPCDVDDFEDALKVVDAMYDAFRDMVNEEEIFNPYRDELRNSNCDFRRKKTCKLECDFKVYEDIDDENGKCNFDNLKPKKPCIEGIFRTFEVTVKFNWKAKRFEIHPHFHCIIGANPAFYKKNRRLKPYNNVSWGRLWEYYLARHVDIDLYKSKPEDILQCHVEGIVNKKVKEEDYIRRSKEANDKLEEERMKTINNCTKIDHKKLQAISDALKAKHNVDYDFKTINQAMKAFERDKYNAIGAVKEAGKYNVKDTDIVMINKDGKVKRNDTDKAVAVLDAIFKDRRLFCLYGAFKKASKVLDLKLEVDKEEKISKGVTITDDKIVCKKCGSELELILTKFNFSGQIYQDEFDGGELDFVAGYVMNHLRRIERKKDKKKSDESSHAKHQT